MRMDGYTTGNAVQDLGKRSRKAANRGNFFHPHDDTLEELYVLCSAIDASAMQFLENTKHVMRSNFVSCRYGLLWGA